MRRHGRAGATGALAMLTAAGLAGMQAPAAAAPEELVIGQTTLGNIFVDDRTASFRVSSSGDSIAWRVMDPPYGEVLSGESAGGDLTLELPRLKLGQYVLEVESRQGGAVIDTASNQFALIESWDQERDPRFGMNTKFGLPATGKPPVWDPETNSFTGAGEPRYSLDMMPILKQTGTAGARDTLPWNNFEPEEKLYAGGPPWYGDYIRALDRADITPLVILSYGNKLYDVDRHGIGAAPYTEEGIQAYADYARAVLSSYDGAIGRVEVWNEYNGNAPWNRGPCRLSPECYYEMLKVTYETVKETHPEAQVVGPAAVTLPYGWLEQLFALGALEYLDAVTVHPYGIPASPENGYYLPSEGNRGLANRIEQLDELIRKYNGGEAKPIWFTEIGWGSYENPRNPRGVTEQLQAAYMVRSHVISFANGVDAIYWYSLRNDKVLPSGPGANWGLVRDVGDPLGTYAPKESFTAYTTMTRQLSGARFVARDDTPDGVRSYHFSTLGAGHGAGKPGVRVMWAPEGSRKVTIRTGGTVEVTQMDGATERIAPTRGLVELTLTSDPIYVEGKVVRVHSGDRGHGSDRERS